MLSPSAAGLGRPSSEGDEPMASRTEVHELRAKVEKLVSTARWQRAEVEKLKGILLSLNSLVVLAYAANPGWYSDEAEQAS